MALALSPANSAALSYFNRTNNWLYFAEWTGSAWQTSAVDTSLQSAAVVTVDSRLSYGSPTSLVFIGSVPHIVYYDAAGQRLLHAYRPAGSWIKEIISSALPSGGAPAAAACGSSLCVSFYNGSTKDLQFAKGSAGAWTVSTIDSTGDVGAMSALAVKPDGYAAIIYFDATNRTPKTAIQSSAASWSVAQLKYLNHSFGIYPSLTASTGGTLYAAFSRYQPAGSPVDRGLYLAKLSPGASWDIGLVSDDYAGGPLQIKIDGAGRPAVVSRYLRKNSTYGDAAGVRLWNTDPSGQWTTQTMSGEYGFSGSNYSYESLNLAYALTGEPKIVYGFNQASPPLSEIRLHGSPGPAAGGAATSTTIPATTSTVAASTTSVATTSTVVTTSTSLPSTSTSTVQLTTTLSSTTTSVAAASSPIRIEAGGAAYTDPSGITWSADSLFSGGEGDSSSTAVAGTANDKIYQTYRSGPSFRYSIPVNSGSYTVNLHFSEPSSLVTAAGQRVFNISLEGQTLLAALDIYKEASKNAALIKTFSLMVTDGNLDIEFTGLANSALVSAIEIIPAAAPPAATTAPTTVTTATTTTTSVPTTTSTVSTSTRPTSTTTAATTSTISTTTSVPPAAASVRIEAGGGSFTDSGGKVWQPDSMYSGGELDTTAAAVAGTVDDKLYQTYRSGRSFSYSVPLRSGIYRARLNFSEPSSLVTAVGQRVFDVSLEGQPALTAFDILQSAAKNTALIKTFYLTVTDGALDIRFSGIINSALVSAIEIDEQSADGLLINCGGLAVADSSGKTWISDLGFTGGLTMSATGTIRNTASQTVAKQMRYAPYTFGYRLPVPNGRYDVIFHFVEPTATAARMRVFNTRIEGVVQISNLDIYQQRGRNNELQIGASAAVSDGELAIDFIPVYTGQSGIVSAIEIHKLP